MTEYYNANVKLSDFQLDKNRQWCNFKITLRHDSTDRNNFLQN